MDPHRMTGRSSAARPPVVRSAASRRRRGRIAVAVPAALAAAAVLAAGAAGHGSVTSVSPPPGAELESAPRAVTATYNEPVVAVRAAVVSIDGRDTRVTAVVATGNRRRVVVPLPSRGPGAYRVSWVVVSADGHPVAGETAFRVREVPVSVTLLRTAARARATARALERAVLR